MKSTANIQEIFKDIPNYEGLYQVSNLGRVKSLDRLSISESRIKGKHLKPQKGKQYYHVELYKYGKGKTRTIHQLVAESFLNHKPCGYALVINHIDHNKLNNKVENLEIITSRENSDQKHLKSSSEYTGVQWCKQSKKWRSVIVVERKNISLGFFISEKEAAKYYQDALICVVEDRVLDIKVKHKSKTSVYKNVSWDKSRCKWVARVKNKYIGRYTTEEDAYTATIMS